MFRKKLSFERPFVKIILNFKYNIKCVEDRWGQSPCRLVNERKSVSEAVCQLLFFALFFGCSIKIA